VSMAGDEQYFTPDPSHKEHAWTKDYARTYQEFLADKEGFWERQAHHLEWIKKWDKVLEWDYPYAKWFVNAKLNITCNCLDRNVANHRRNKVALIWKGEEGEERIFTYKKLLHEVCRFANGLKKLGVTKGDRVCIYMPLVPEQVIAMLACARIGAVHSVVFGGFGVNALNMRINDAEAKVVITADVTIRRGKTIPLKTIVEEAIINAPSVEKVVILSRQVDQPVELHKEIEIDFYELMEGVSSECTPEIMDAEDPLFILYTSGSTGTPKGIVHTCGGYMVGTYYTTLNVFDVKDTDVYWCTADTGWITGHSYVVYGPFCVGATVVLAEAVPDYPDPGSFWKIIQDLGVTIFYTAPTSIRMMITTMVGERMRPGFAGKAIPGVVADVVDKQGKPVAPGNGGFLVIQDPWPSMLRTVYKNDERYRTYWTTIPGYYTAGDLAVKGKDGYIMIIGRADDIIIMAGHNIGTAEVESALVSHKAVAEAAVIGKPDPLKGNIIKAFVILRVGFQPSEKLKSDLIYHVRMTLGPIAMPSEIEFMDKLPKTRSGKIMRRVLKAKEMGIDPGDVSTLEE
jgi:acetyl-CoA synthetase